MGGQRRKWRTSPLSVSITNSAAVANRPSAACLYERLVDALQDQGRRGIDVGQGTDRAADGLGEAGRTHPLATDIGDKDSDRALVEGKDVEEVASHALGRSGGAMSRTDAQ